MNNELITKLTSNQLTDTDRDKVLLYIANKLDAQDDINKEIKKSIDGLKHFQRNMEDEVSLMLWEADELAMTVRKKGVEVLGGKRSNAYKDGDLRRKVYRDIYYEIKREYGLIDERGCQLSYKKLKRKYFKGALAVVGEYEAPIGIRNEITSLNELDEDE